MLGTGDLSELALGWCTYGVGDQMSHYAVNTGVPKTLIQHLIRWVVSSNQFGEDDAEVNDLLTEIVEQEITPELVPAGEGEAPQSTEGTSGPTRCTTSPSSTCCGTGSGPSKIAFLAQHAWSRRRTRGCGRRASPTQRRVAYDLADDPALARGVRAAVLRPASSSARRCPNGPKVSAGGSLSPRGDWRMPSRRERARLARRPRPSPGRRQVLSCT